MSGMGGKSGKSGMGGIGGMDGTATDARIAAVEHRIQSACAQAGRSRSSVRLIAVTKAMTPQRLQTLCATGLEHFGENRWQSLALKWPVFPHAKWHFIGHIQKNKVQRIVQACTMLHSIDRASIATHVDDAARACGKTIDVCIQVNIAEQPQKFGIAPSEALELVQHTNALQHMRVVGLMTMAPHTENTARIADVFRALRTMQEEINARGAYRTPLTELSMGMSDDVDIAIREGATMVRIGSALGSDDV
jgi:pyridoxal phosphate enzyme (YggS family)